MVLGGGGLQCILKGGDGFHKNGTFWSFKMILSKSVEKAPHVFEHFLIFLCKFARRFLKRLCFWPPVSFQRKSSKNFTPFSSHFIKEKKPRIIGRWRCLSKLHSKISLKRGRKGKKVKGFDLIDLRLATTSYHPIVFTVHNGTYQTNCLI